MAESGQYMEVVDRKHGVSLGVRVGAVFLITVITVIMVAYYVLSQNFQGLLTNYSIKLIEAMAAQGVNMVEIELAAGRQEALFLADSFSVPEPGAEVKFRYPYAEDGYLRVVYVTETETVSSDGRKLDVRDRQDIRDAFEGITGVYGPYFNEENEYVVCYSAPVRQGDHIAGVLSVEKDGYRFCEIIKDIRFVNSGESYIINAEGTDIAVSDQNHIDWVNSQYNARQLYEDQADEETKSIIELESRGLNGETGIGTYYWHSGLCYVFYHPIPSTGWVLLAGMREEELHAMTQSALVAFVSDGPLLGFCLLLVLFLTALIVYWIIASMKKAAEINNKLELIANFDSLTGLKNQNSYHVMLNTLSKEESSHLVCIYVDVNGLHELNNYLGHQAGDSMLKTVADTLRRAFPKEEVYRIGGDEFVVLCREKPEQEVRRVAEQVKVMLHRQNYDISMGIVSRQEGCSIMDMIDKAEDEMQRDKKQFYEDSGNVRNMRILEKKMTQIVSEKRDADTFIEFLAPGFQGVYFVNLNRDTVRHIFIPSYFEECLKEAGNQFSRALVRYAEKNVEPEYYQDIAELCDYSKLEKQLDSGQQPELVYQKRNGDWLKLRILKFRDYTSEQKETLWIFAVLDGPEK